MRKRNNIKVRDKEERKKERRLGKEMRRNIQGRLEKRQRIERKVDQGRIGEGKRWKKETKGKTKGRKRKE